MKSMMIFILFSIPNFSTLACEDSLFLSQPSSYYKASEQYLLKLLKKGVLNFDNFEKWLKSSDETLLLSQAQKPQTNQGRILIEGFDELFLILSSEEQATLKNSFLSSHLSENLSDFRMPIETQDLSDSFHYPKAEAILKKGKYSLHSALEIQFHQDLAIRQTLITQIEWFKLLGGAPSYHQRGPDSYQFRSQITGSKVAIRPMMPVESFTWWSALEFTNELSRREGLKPVYDLSEIRFQPETSAADGTLAPEDEVSALQRLRIQAPNGNIYLAEGFRLPTVFEICIFQDQSMKAQAQDGSLRFAEAFVLRDGRGRVYEPQPVLSRSPVYLDQLPIYDGIGNLSVFASDFWWKESSTSIQRKSLGNPYGPLQREYRQAVGASFKNQQLNVRLIAALMTQIQSSERKMNVGLRVVRSLNPNLQNPVLTLKEPPAESLRRRILRLFLK